MADPLCWFCGKAPRAVGCVELCQVCHETNAAPAAQRWSHALRMLMDAIAELGSEFPVSAKEMLGALAELPHPPPPPLPRPGFVRLPVWNRCAVGVRGDQVVVLLPPLTMTKPEALAFAANLVAIADDYNEFPTVLEAVQDCAGEVELGREQP